MKAFVSQAHAVEFCFQPLNTGLTDVVLKVYNDSGELETTLAMNHIVGGVYRANYTATTTGRRLLQVSSASLGRNQWTALEVFEIDPSELIKDLYMAHFRKRIWNGTNTITVFDKSGAVVDKTFNTDGDLSEISPGNFTPKI